MITDFSDYLYNSLHCWNGTAIQCYKRGCVCEGCPIIKNLETVTIYSCQMKKAVVALVKKFGPPKEKED